MGQAWLAGRCNVVGGSTSENHDIEERVGSKPVGAVHRGTASLACSVETRHNLAVVVANLGHDLAVLVGGNATHVVVNSRAHRDRFLGHVDASEDGSGLGDSRQALVQDLTVAEHESAICIDTRIWGFPNDLDESAGCCEPRERYQGAAHPKRDCSVQISEFSNLLGHTRLHCLPGHHVKTYMNHVTHALATQS